MAIPYGDSSTSATPPGPEDRGPGGDSPARRRMPPTPALAVEIRAGVTTFLTMSYILVANPAILAGEGIPAGQRMPADDVAAATAISAAVASIVMGLVARLPVGLAPGMGLNAFFAFGVVVGMGIPWRVALAAVFTEGVLFIALSLTGVRRLLLRAVPHELRLATTVGIGLFLVLIGLQSAGVVISGDDGLLLLGDLHSPAVLCTLGGVVVIAVLQAWRVPGALIGGVALAAAVSWATGSAPGPAQLWDWPRFPSETLFALQFGGVGWGTFAGVVCAFLFVDLFDTAGTLIAVGVKGDLLDESGELRNADRAFLADAIGTTCGALLGTSTVTSYIESAAGIEEGGRTGATAITVGVLFLLSLAFAPLVTAVPAAAVAPALVVVGGAMLEGAGGIAWRRPEVALPATLCIALMPFTHSIANGIAAGLVATSAIHLAIGKGGEVSRAVHVLAVVIVVFRAFSP